MVDNYFVLVDIGCLECGEDSALIGVFTEREKAEKANLAVLQGWRVLTFDGKSVKSGEAVEIIRQALEAE